MRMRDFIKKYRKEIDDTIAEQCGNPARFIKITNEDREQWVLNNEYLYDLARREGVKV
jgi:hypothetical protein